MIGKSELYERNSYNLCEPDCPHLKTDKLEKTAVCSYYGKILDMWEQGDGDKQNVGQSKWFICGECYEACFDDSFYKDLEDGLF